MAKKRDWKTEPIVKYGDVAPPEERIRRKLPELLPYRQNMETAEIALRREADAKFRIKRSS